MSAGGHPDTSLRLTVVGAAAAWADGPGQPSSCYLVEHGEAALVLDIGQGSLGALRAVRDVASLTAIVISHLHPDHHVDLVALRHLLRFGMGAPRRVPLWAPAALRVRYDLFLGESDFLAASFDGGALEAGQRVLAPFALDARPVLHASDSHAFRVSDAGRPAAPGLVYSGDCARWQDLVPLLRPGDTLLCEAFWGAAPADPGAMHLTADDAAQAALAGDASRLVLTHLGEAADPETAIAAARMRFTGEVLLAVPGLRLTVD